MPKKTMDNALARRAVDAIHGALKAIDAEQQRKANGQFGSGGGGGGSTKRPKQDPAQHVSEHEGKMQEQAANEYVKNKRAGMSHNEAINAVAHKYSKSNSGTTHEAEVAKVREAVNNLV
jgi:hypothetical protein